MPKFSHLHCHTQFSLLDGAANIEKMIAKAADDNMPAAAITDHGNMFGVFQFVNAANKAGIIPVVGCEFYVVDDRFQKTFTKDKPDVRYHQLLLAKNQQGYQNLSKLCSLGFIDGLYGKFPRVDRDLVNQYKGGLIATTCCIGAEVPQTIIRKGEEEGEKVFRYWLEMFGEDYYIELQRHHIENIDGSGLSQEDVNRILIKWSEKYNVPIIATNDSHYVDEDDWNAHDILLCVNTGDKQSTPKGSGKGFRFGFPNSAFYLKSTDEMMQLFHDLPEAIDNTNLIIDKITPPQLQRDILLPAYTLPEGFKTQDEYLSYLAFEGAKKRYGQITSEIEERLNFELQIIEKSGYPGYFLIVQDFTTVARDLGVSVGPGRGSAAGSAVAYCLGITNVDPIKYDLLFERFLNPERVSMPDIDIDFDDAGRQKVIDYVVNKYGKNQVAQIVTYGKMAAKLSIRDVGRVLDLPLPEVDRICKSFPDHLSASLNKVLADGGVDTKLKDKLNGEQLSMAKDFRKMAEQKDLVGQTIQTAKVLEGSVRNTGVHACGVIITPDDIRNFVPVAVSKDSDLYLTQFDNNVVEKAGLLKMDFLGLKTLTVIKRAIENVKKTRGIDIDPDALGFDDKKTFELFQKGKTDGIFQFESEGMKKYLKELKPNKLEDLIAMNALYRPGPLEYIPNFIKRKHGEEKIEYDLPEMKEYLEETYGITVYQEQVMLLSQKLANFTKGQADRLRKAMGKKIKAEMDVLYPMFLEGCEKNGHDEKIAKKIWKDWEAFAQYAFNKSHSTCYAIIAYQTAYLKANYPAEFLAGLMSCNMNDHNKLSLFLNESKKSGVKILGPDINESEELFTANQNKEVRFALSAIKGMGKAVVGAVIEERESGGKFKSIFDLTRRMSSKSLNKKSLEALILGGAFDSFGFHRAQYFNEAEGENLIEKALKFGKKVSAENAGLQASLFGDDELGDIQEPAIPECEEWNLLEQLQNEKKVIGIYLTGHPLDDYRIEMESLCSCPVDDLEKFKGKPVTVGGIIISTSLRKDKKGNDMCFFELEDFIGSIRLGIFKETYLKYGHLIKEGVPVLIKGSYDKSWRDENQFHLNIKSVQLLAEIKEKEVKSVLMEFNLNDISDEWIDILEAYCTKHSGKTTLQIKIKHLVPKPQKKTAEAEVPAGVDADDIFEDEFQNESLETDQLGSFDEIELKFNAGKNIDITGDAFNELLNLLPYNNIRFIS